MKNEQKKEDVKSNELNPEENVYEFAGKKWGLAKWTLENDDYLKPVVTKIEASIKKGIMPYHLELTGREKITFLIGALVEKGKSWSPKAAETNRAFIRTAPIELLSEVYVDFLSGNTTFLIQSAMMFKTQYILSQDLQKIMKEAMKNTQKEVDKTKKELNKS